MSGCWDRRVRPLNYGEGPSATRMSNTFKNTDQRDRVLQGLAMATKSFFGLTMTNPIALTFADGLSIVILKRTIGAMFQRFFGAQRIFLGHILSGFRGGNIFGTSFRGFSGREYFWDKF